MSSWSNTLQAPAATSQGPTSTVVEHTRSRQDRAENIYNGQPTHNDPLFDSLTSPGQPQLRMEESQSAMNISSLISENQSIFNSYDPPLFGRSNLQNATGTQSSNVENEYHEDPQGTGLWYQGSFTAIDWLQDAWTPDFPMEDRDEGLDSFDQCSSHLLGNAPGICERGRGIERTKCNEKRPHCGQCDGRKLNCVYGTAQPPTSRSQSSMLMQHDGYGQYRDDDCSTQYGLVPGQIQFSDKRSFGELQTTSCYEDTGLPVDNGVRDIARSPLANAHVKDCPTVPPPLFELSVPAFMEFSEKRNRRALIDYFCNVFSHLVVFSKDLGNPFRQLILPLAHKESPVMNTICALSSAHVESSRGVNTEEKSSYFHNKATRGLARLINHRERSSTEGVLGAIMLLVYYGAVGEHL